MFPSQLIVGGSKEKRRKLAEKIIQKYLGLKVLRPHPDFLLIEGENSLGINQVRKLTKFLSRKPYLANLKVAFLKEAEKLTLPAQNALLKTLEEPPPHSLIILLAPSKEALLSTIVSRCRLEKLAPESQICLSSLDWQQYLKLFSQLNQKKIGQRLKEVSPFAKDKDRAKEFVFALIHFQRQQLLNRPSLTTAQNLHQSQFTLQLLAANVHPHLALGNLVLSLADSPKI